MNKEVISWLKWIGSLPLIIVMAILAGACFYLLGGGFGNIISEDDIWYTLIYKQINAFIISTCVFAGFFIKMGIVISPVKRKKIAGVILMIFLTTLVLVPITIKVVPINTFTIIQAVAIFLTGLISFILAIKQKSEE